MLYEKLEKQQDQKIYTLIPKQAQQVQFLVKKQKGPTKPCERLEGKRFSVQFKAAKQFEICNYTIKL